LRQRNRLAELDELLRTAELETEGLIAIFETA
jgi:hypothetical protein